MYVALQIVASLSVLAEPFLPFTASKLENMLNCKLEWNDVSTNSDLLPAGNKIGQAELLFSKIEDEEVQKQIDKLEATKKILTKWKC